MDSPLNAGDTTANSITNMLSDTHLRLASRSIVEAAVYSGQEMIQFTMDIKQNYGEEKSNEKVEPIVILRRVQDSFINVSQLFSILVRLGQLTDVQLANYFGNEILSNLQYMNGGGETRFLFEDLSGHEVEILRGIWVPYDKAVSLAWKFDIYELTKRLFLVDVHSYDTLPKVRVTGKRRNSDNQEDESVEKAGDVSGDMSPTKKRKSEASHRETIEKDRYSLLLRLSKDNSNFPYPLAPLSISEGDVQLVSTIKMKYSEIFKDTDRSSSKLLKETFEPILDRLKAFMMDIPLDRQGKTALHFAATLASSELVSCLIELDMCSPVRGTVTGESTLVLTILVTNSMEKGNFLDLLDGWLWPCLWLVDQKKWTVFHYLVDQSIKKSEASKFYFTKILEWCISSDNGKKQNALFKVSNQLINIVDEEAGNTCLHMAAENESSWFIEMLLELNADTGVPNKRGVRPLDFDIVKDLVAKREASKLVFSEEHDNYISDLVRTGMEFLQKKTQMDVEDRTEDGPTYPQGLYGKHKEEPSNPLSGKIFKSIQELLSNTNSEYENILNNKNEQVVNLNKALYDATLVTANNRFVTGKIMNKLVDLDKLKLQMANVSHKLQGLENENAQLEENDTSSEDVPFVVKQLYDAVAKGENVDNLENKEEIVKQLPPVSTLKARIRAYERGNKEINDELSSLLNYSELTMKFKKVVSYCTGVNINEVDELLNGLLEAVETQN